MTLLYDSHIMIIVTKSYNEQKDIEDFRTRCCYTA